MPINPIIMLSEYYQPDSIMRRHIIEKFSADKSPSYIEFGLRSLLGFKPTVSRQSVFDEDLLKLNRTKNYRLSGVIALVLSLPISVVLSIMVILNCSIKSLSNRKKFFFNILRSKYRGVTLGDCVGGVFLRSGDSEGRLNANISFFKILHRIYLLAIFLDLFLVFSRLNKLRPGYFYICELNAGSEACRRILLKHNFVELRYNYEVGKFKQIQEKLEACEIIKSEFNAETQSPFDPIKTKEKIRSLVFRETSYHLLVDCDVDKDLKLSISDVDDVKSVFGRKVAIIFLHQVSDAAYVFGLDCFVDLDDWLFQSIKILNACNIAVIVKLHPAFFSETMTYPIDIRYLDFLNRTFDVDLERIEQGKIHKSNKLNAMFVQHKTPLLELSRSFPDFLCVTHHGTVATEAAYLGHVVAVNDASPYRNNHKFVNIYSSLDEYSCLVKSWANGTLKQDPEAETSLLRYVHNRQNIVDHERWMETFRNSLGFSFAKEKAFITHLEGVQRNSAEYLAIHKFFDKIF
ncbi:hypothetical protein N8157_01115 [Burkholderiales bacterium]|nr:hypothetical protein [Burkholderiales bacterium]